MNDCFTLCIIYPQIHLFSTIKAHNQQLVEDPIHSQIRWRNWIGVKRFIVAIYDTPLASSCSLVAVENRPALSSKNEIVAVVFQSREWPSLASVVADYQEDELSRLKSRWNCNYICRCIYSTKR